MLLSFGTRANFFTLSTVILFLFSISSQAFAFDDKDCQRVETVPQSYSLDLKSQDSVVTARAKVTDEIVKAAIIQVIGYEVHSAREQNTQITNDTAQAKYQDAERALLDGLVRVRVLDETRSALPDGQTLTIKAEVKVCVPKPDAVRLAEKEKEDRLRHPPKTIDPSSAVWFNPGSGQPQIWFSKGADGDYSFYDNSGFDPSSGEALLPVNPKIIREWKASQAKRRRDEAARLEREKRDAEQAALNEQRDRAAAALRADLVAHARENCDKYAANPNDPAKPKDIVGATYDELRAGAENGVKSCEAAVEVEPLDRRLKYQLARAYSATDPKRAMPLFKALMDQHYLAAFDNYGWAFIDRRVGISNLASAIAVFRQGANLGDSDAMVSLAGYIHRGKTPSLVQDEDIKLYQRAANLGNADASRALEPVLAERQQAQLKQQQDLQNAQAVMGIMNGFLGGAMRR